jgi:hypothetical protein
MDATGSNRVGGTQTTSAGRSFLSTVMSRLPIGVQILDNISQLNPKYETFQDLVIDRNQRVNDLSITRQQQDETEGLMGSLLADKNYQRFMYANLDLDKIKRLQDYRRMAGYSVLNDCLEEICDELFTEDEKNRFVLLKLQGDFSKAVEETIQKEWDKYIQLFKLKDRGWQCGYNFMVDGELFWENVISDTHPEFGILGVVSVPTELINPFYKNQQNDIIEGYAVRKPLINPKSNQQEKEQLIILEPRQVTYIHTGRWGEGNNFKVPYIENARKSYKQLSLIEDSIVIHRLVRAPQRLVFKVDVGNLTPPKAEAYMKRLMQNYWSKKTYDTSTGRITNTYDPQSMLDSYWFPKKTGSEGTTVEALEGGMNLGSLDDLMYFLRALYKSMKVPIGRLDPENVVKDGDAMTREELRFARFLQRIQKQFAAGLKDSFITHLKLRKMWENFKLKEHSFELEFNLPTMYMMLKQNQIFELKYNNFNNMSSNDGVSNSFAQKKYLGLTDDEMAQNREWKRKDAILAYELAKIGEAGPNWKDAEAAGGGAPAEGGGAPAGGGGGGSALPPEFGAAPEAATPAPAEGVAPAGGEGAQAPAGGAEAPASTAVPPVA